ncbi:hypothetical protein [Halomonas aquatica]|uniref:Uncharacterized protein n=1 Tax=Halomonas aquatica TaxID=3151123 RepID=A0ABV1NAF2_9GAMM
MEVGKVKVSYEGKTRIQASKIGSREQMGANAHRYSVAHRDGWQASIGVMDFADSQDVRCLEVGKGAPEAVYRLLHGLRMSISDGPSAGEQWVELSQARIDPEVVPPWSNLKKATSSQLDDGADADVEDVVIEAGGESGTREDLLGDESRRRGYLCCVFRQGELLPPVTSYVLTRLLPLANGYTG